MIICLFLAIAAASSEEIETITVQEGDEISLYCDFGHCLQMEMTHVTANKTWCHHSPDYDFDHDEVVCEDFERSKIHYVEKTGGYHDYNELDQGWKCGVQIEKVRKEDAGEWKCFRTARLRSHDGSMFVTTTNWNYIHLEVENKTNTESSNSSSAAPLISIMTLFLALAIFNVFQL